MQVPSAVSVYARAPSCHTSPTQGRDSSPRRKTRAAVNRLWCGLALIPALAVVACVERTPFEVDAGTSESAPVTPALALLGPDLRLIRVVDPVGDQINGFRIDIVEMELIFDPFSTQYEVTLRADAANPFSGAFRVNVNLFNVDAGTFFSDAVNDYNLSVPTTTLVLSGTSAALATWSVGDRVHTNSLAGTPNPPGISLYRTSINNFAPNDVEPPIGEDVVAFADLAQPVIITDAVPSDRDDDGTPDALDACPDVFGHPANAGCPTPPDDTDGDGVPNSIDQCPNVYGLPALAGCPTPRPTDPATRDLVVVDVDFIGDAWPGSFYPGPKVFWKVFPWAWIENRGPDDAAGFSVEFSMRAVSGAGRATRQVTVPFLAAGARVRIALPDHPSEPLPIGSIGTFYPGEYILTVIADKGDRIAETNEGNNVYIRPVVLPE